MGLDAHDTGITLVSSYLRDAGMEVIYGGIYNTPEKILTMSDEEDVDLIGLSFLTREIYQTSRGYKSIEKQGPRYSDRCGWYSA